MTTPAGAARTTVVADVAADALAESAEPAGRARGTLSLTVAVGILTVIVLFAALYLGRAFFVPLLIGILASYALHPVVDWLKACYVPRAAGGIGAGRACRQPVLDRIFVA